MVGNSSHNKYTRRGEPAINQQLSYHYTTAYMCPTSLFSYPHSLHMLFSYRTRNDGFHPIIRPPRIQNTINSKQRHETKLAYSHSQETEYQGRIQVRVRDISNYGRVIQIAQNNAADPKRSSKSHPQRTKLRRCVVAAVTYRTMHSLSSQACQYSSGQVQQMEEFPVGVQRSD